MPRASGIFTLVPSYRAVSGQTIKTEQHNPPLEDIAQAITESLPRDGSAPMTGDLSMNGRKITGLKAGTADGDAVRKDQVTLYSAYLASVQSLAVSANKLVFASGVSTAALTDLTAFARTILDDVDAATARNTLELKAGALAEKASTPEAEAGADDAKYMTALKTKQAIEAGVGGSQVWTDMSGSRVGGVTYQNTTPRQITVAIIPASTGVFNVDVEVSSDGVSWLVIGDLNGSTYDYRRCIFPVPPGGYYRTASAFGVGEWNELR